MKIIDLKQGCPEWLAFRRGKIGASDAPIIMGVSPFKTLGQLYKEKAEGIEPYKNEAMQRGNDLEATARKEFEDSMVLFEDRLDAKLVPMVAQSDQYEWMIASFDGIDTKNHILVEIKCPGEKDHAIALNSRIPPKYYPQLQHQMYVADYQEMYYFSYRTPTNWCMVECKRSQEYIDKMILKEKEFWDMLQNKTAPPETVIISRRDVYFEALAREYAEVKKKLQALEEKEAELRARLIDAAQGECCSGGGLKLMKQERKGNIDYNKIPQLKGVDLENFRKPSSMYWTVAVES